MSFKSLTEGFWRCTLSWQIELNGIELKINFTAKLIKRLYPCIYAAGVRASPEAGDGRRRAYLKLEGFLMCSSKLSCAVCICASLCSKPTTFVPAIRVFSALFHAYLRLLQGLRFGSRWVRLWRFPMTPIVPRTQEPHSCSRGVTFIWKVGVGTK